MPFGRKSTVLFNHLKKGSMRMSKRLLWIEMLACAALFSSAISQTNQPWFDSPLDGQVNSIVVSGTKAYLGGTFTKIGYACGTGVLLDTISAAPDRTFPKLDPVQGRVYASAPDGNGGWYVGGNFSYVGGLPRKYLVHIRPDHTVDSWNPSPNAFVQCLHVSGNRLYAGGYFTTIAGQTRGYAAAFDITTGALLSWDPKADGEVTAIQQVGSLVYLGGYFYDLNGQSRFTIGSVDTAGNVTSWAPGATIPYGEFSVTQFIYANGYLYACGPFVKIDTVTLYGLAKMDASGNVIRTWKPAISISGGFGTVGAMTLANGKLYVGGSFTSIAGRLVTNLACIDTGTGLASAWNPAPNQLVRAMTAIGSRIYVGGDFTSIGGKNWSWMAAVDTSTGLATSWDAEVNEDPYTMTTDGTSLFAGGLFTSTGNVTRNNLAAVDLTTGHITSWNPNASGGVSALAVVADKIIVGGNYTSLNGISHANLAAVDTVSGTMVPSSAWNATAGGAVNAMMVLGNRLYLGGSFGNVNGTPRGGLAAINKNTGALLPWRPTMDQSGIYSFASSGSLVFTSGFFTQVYGQPRNYAAAFDTTTDSLTAWNPSPSYLCWSLASQNGVVYLGGGFTTVGGVTRKSIAAVDTAKGALFNNFNANFNLQLNVNAIQPIGSQIIIGGQFEQIDTLTREQLAYLDANTGAVSSWSSNINNNIGSGTVYSLALAPHTLLVGGEIISILNFPQQNLAVLIDSSIMLKPGLGASPRFINFGSVALGMVKDTVLTVANSGAAALNVTSIVSSGNPFTVHTVSASLMPGQSLVDTIQFKPAALGAAFGSVVISSNASTSPDTIQVFGTGVGGPVLQLSSRLVAFGNITIGQTKDTTVTVTNAGNDTLTIVGITVTSTAAFGASQPLHILLPGQSFDDTISFKPVNAEPAQTYIIFASNSAGSPDTIKVTGKGTSATGVASGGPVVPDHYSLAQNFPNPFNPSTTIQYGLPAASRVTLRIYNVLGQVVADLIDGEQQAGMYEVNWNANVSSGLYFCRIEAMSSTDPNSRFVEVRKMVLMK